MHRFFAEGTAQQLSLSEQDHHHAVRVLRLKKGEKIECVLDGLVYEVMIDSLEPLTLSTIREVDEHHELPFHLTLLYVVPKGDKWPFVLQKAVELGVNEVIALHSSFSVVHWSADTMKQKQARHDAIIREASMQSKRSKLMQCSTYLSFKQALTLPFNHAFIASEHDKDFKNPFTHAPFAQGERVALLIGSEGGFSLEEVAQAKDHGFQPLSLGPRILRSETAVIVGLSYLTKEANA